jgi:soluble P-type ATPase
MLEIDIPGFGLVKLEYLVSDYTGTLSLEGKMLPQVREKLNAVAHSLKVFVLTADEFGKAQEELKEVDCTVHIVIGKDMDVQKAEFVKKLGAEKTVALGNGANDREMLKVSKIGIVVAGREGCSIESLLAADVQVARAVDGLDLLLKPRRLRATLKF